ncbi:MAG: aldo/keto reductase [Atopobiaceae bacterium]|nr:aldo/keto reductase [Atopobiaceae bacterium]
MNATAPTTHATPFEGVRGKLSFGCMRLPKLEDGAVDIATFTQMVDAFLDGGLNYFDTARPYHSGGSEPSLAQALVAVFEM